MKPSYDYENMLAGTTSEIMSAMSSIESDKRKLREVQDMVFD